MSDARPGAGYFRTPIAAAMLSGVLASALTLLMDRWLESLIQVPYPNITTYLIAYYTMNYITNITHMAGPAICLRDSRLIWLPMIFAIPVVVMQFVIYYVFEHVVLPGLGVTSWPATKYYYMVLMIFVSMLTTWSLTFFTASLYGLRPCPGRIHRIALFAGAIAAGLSTVTEFAFPDTLPQREAMALSVMATVIIGLIAITLPAIAIERSLQIRAAEARLAHEQAQPASAVEAEP